MIEVKSYIGSINIEGGEKFTLMGDYDGVIDDPRHIDGAIELIIDGKYLISQEQWDLVDLLWLYIVDGIESVINGTDYSSSFPDSSVELSLKKTALPDKIEMTIDGQSIVCDRQELINTLLDAAEYCLTELSRLMNDRSFYRSSIEKIQKLKIYMSK
jgi:hypothetical protein